MPVLAFYRPRGPQEVEAPIFRDNERIKMIRLVALGTSHFYPLGNIPGTHSFLLRPHYSSGVDSASNGNEYQEYFLGVKAAGA
jgi:hypothetical protein